MNEEIVIWQYAVAIFGLATGSVLYSMGGYRGKWKRRFVGSFVITAIFNGVCYWRGIWSPWLMLSFPTIIGAFCLPYGAGTLFPKIIKRTCVVLACVGAGLGFCILNGGNAWWVFVPHLGIGLWSIYLGVKNPIQARAEEGFICILLCLGLMMYPFIG